ncbi:TPA: hypothetical protein ACOQ31_006071 [Bacillus cereus]|uniref:hypothetical protein n=1 Tax=Bacillus cereus group TaxID=86661 RepID=UPI000241E738|nr:MULTISPECIES: hypothetical protein [Bacillus cereus group]AEW58612.1 hypothetical protein bcf_27615 [Bacillus cereus F837/76]AJH66319.1 hypothetical protein BF32_5494 [Bacillus thuringiensis]MEB9454196.1 hypothetical protein [Bacillus anthracis]QKH33363.1 hypothetical protein FOC87_27225 [Bacillus thuringiensis]QKQ37840.1 hypothetical protein FOC85_00315 [Bacillus thuringiensis]
MSELALYEMKCVDDDCGKISLQELDSERYNNCPYCGDDVMYTPGKIEPVLVYTPRSERNSTK